MKPFELLQKKELVKGHIINLYDYEYKTPAGNLVHWDVIEHKGASAIVPVDENGNILMVRQYRGPVDEFLLEIPAGGRDSVEEDFEICAMRELEEETGFRTDQAHHLATYYSAAAYTNERIELYYTDHLIPSHQNLDEDEFIQVKSYPLETLIAMIFSGEIKDGKSIAALLAYDRLIHQEEHA